MRTTEALTSRSRFTVLQFGTGAAVHYRLERELGRDSMATVCPAHDLRHDRPAALKRPPAPGASCTVERYEPDVWTVQNFDPDSR